MGFIWVGKEIFSFEGVLLLFFADGVDVVIGSWKPDVYLELRVIIDIFYKFLKVFELNPRVHIGKILPYCMHDVFRPVESGLPFKPVNKLFRFGIQIVALQSWVVFDYIDADYRIEKKTFGGTVVEILDVSEYR